MPIFEFWNTTGMSRVVTTPYRRFRNFLFLNCPPLSRE